MSKAPLQEGSDQERVEASTDGGMPTTSPKTSAAGAGDPPAETPLSEASAQQTTATTAEGPPAEEEPETSADALARRMKLITGAAKPLGAPAPPRSGVAIAPPSGAFSASRPQKQAVAQQGTAPKPVEPELLSLDEDELVEVTALTPAAGTEVAAVPPPSPGLSNLEPVRPGEAFDISDVSGDAFSRPPELDKQTGKTPTPLAVSPFLATEKEATEKEATEKEAQQQPHIVVGPGAGDVPTAVPTASEPAKQLSDEFAPVDPPRQDIATRPGGLEPSITAQLPEARRATPVDPFPERPRWIWAVVVAIVVAIVLGVIWLAGGGKKGDAKKAGRGDAPTQGAKPARSQGVKPADATTPKPDLAKPDLAKPDLAKPDLAKPDLAKPDLAKPDLAKMNPSKVTSKRRPRKAVRRKRRLMRRRRKRRRRKRRRRKRRRRKRKRKETIDPFKE